VHTALFTEVGVAGVVADEFNSPFFRNVISGTARGDAARRKQKSDRWLIGNEC
jgi:hypothetical protein